MDDDTTPRVDDQINDDYGDAMVFSSAIGADANNVERSLNSGSGLAQSSVTAREFDDATAREFNDVTARQFNDATARQFDDNTAREFVNFTNRQQPLPPNVQAQGAQNEQAQNNQMVQQSPRLIQQTQRDISVTQRQLDDVTAREFDDVTAREIDDVTARQFDATQRDDNAFGNIGNDPYQIQQQMQQPSSYFGQKEFGRQTPSSDATLQEFQDDVMPLQSEIQHQNQSYKISSNNFAIPSQMSFQNIQSQDLSDKSQFQNDIMQNNQQIGIMLQSDQKSELKNQLASSDFNDDDQTYRESDRNLSARDKDFSKSSIQGTSTNLYQGLNKEPPQIQSNDVSTNNLHKNSDISQNINVVVESDLGSQQISQFNDQSSQTFNSNQAIMNSKQSSIQLNVKNQASEVIQMTSSKPSTGLANNSNVSNQNDVKNQISNNSQVLINPQTSQSNSDYFSGSNRANQYTNEQKEIIPGTSNNSQYGQNSLKNGSESIQYQNQTSLIDSNQAQCNDVQKNSIKDTFENSSSTNIRQDNNNNSYYQNQKVESQSAVQNIHNYSNQSSVDNSQLDIGIGRSKEISQQNFQNSNLGIGIISKSSNNNQYNNHNKNNNMGNSIQSSLNLSQNLMNNMSHSNMLSVDKSYDKNFQKNLNSSNAINMSDLNSRRTEFTSNQQPQLFSNKINPNQLNSRRIINNDSSIITGIKNDQNASSVNEMSLIQGSSHRFINVEKNKQKKEEDSSSEESDEDEEEEEEQGDKKNQGQGNEPANDLIAIKKLLQTDKVDQVSFAHLLRYESVVKLRYQEEDSLSFRHTAPCSIICKLFLWGILLNIIVSAQTYFNITFHEQFGQDHHKIFIWGFGHPNQTLLINFNMKQTNIFHSLTYLENQLIPNAQFAAGFNQTLLLYFYGYEFNSFNALTFQNDWPKGLQIRDDGGRCKNLGLKFQGLPRNVLLRSDFIGDENSPFFEDLTDINQHFFGAGSQQTSQVQSTFDLISKVHQDGSRIFIVDNFDYLKIDFSQVDQQKSESCSIQMILERQCLNQDVWELYFFLLKYFQVLIIVFQFVRSLKQIGANTISNSYKVKFAISQSLGAISTLLQIYYTIFNPNMRQVFSTFLYIALPLSQFWIILIEITQLNKDEGYQQMNRPQKFTSWIKYRIGLDIIYRDFHDPDDRFAQNLVKAILQDLVYLKVAHDDMAYDRRTFRPYVYIMIALSSYNLAKMCGTTLAIQIKRFILNLRCIQVFRYLFELIIGLLVIEMFIFGPIPFTEFNFSITGFWQKDFETQVCLSDKYQEIFIMTRITAQSKMIIQLLTIYTPSMLIFLYFLRSFKSMVSSLKYIYCYSKILRQSQTEESTLFDSKMNYQQTEDYKRRLKEKQSTIDLDSLIEAREFMSIQNQSLSGTGVQNNSYGQKGLFSERSHEINNHLTSNSSDKLRHHSHKANNSNSAIQNYYPYAHNQTINSNLVPHSSGHHNSSQEGSSSGANFMSPQLASRSSLSGSQNNHSVVSTNKIAGHSSKIGIGERSSGLVPGEPNYKPAVTSSSISAQQISKMNFQTSSATPGTMTSQGQGRQPGQGTILTGSVTIGTGQNLSVLAGSSAVDVRQASLGAQNPYVNGYGMNSSSSNVYHQSPASMIGVNQSQNGNSQNQTISNGQENSLSVLMRQSNRRK